MEYRELVKGVKIPVLGLGTWGIGGWEASDPSRDDESIASLRAGIELGMTHIDTAEMYAGGHCEEVVGEAIKPYDREELFITTKVWRSHLRFNDVIKAIKGSLRRLGLDYVDLYLVHWPNPAVPLKETMGAMEHCIDEGYTRFIGVSNFDRSLLEEAQSYLNRHRIVADQVEYSLLEQRPRETLLPYCQGEGVMLIAYTPLAKGRLAMPGSPVLEEMAERYGKIPGQVALNWLISQEGVIAIPKASKIEHLRENVGAVGWRLSLEDWIRLGDAYRQVGSVH